jgi:hypothetical protein
MANFTGRWVGEVRGTNGGTFALTLEQAGDALNGELVLNDLVFGPATFDVQDTASVDAAAWALKPRQAAPGVEITPGAAKVARQFDGSLAGNWEMEGHTSGTFIAIREAPAPEAGAQAASASRPAARAITHQPNGGLVSYRWMPIMGEFETSDDRLLYRGRKVPAKPPGLPEPSGPEFLATVGILLCDRKMVNGRLRATVTFDEITPHSVCELILGHDLKTRGQVTAGLGGSGGRFSIRKWVPASPPEQQGGSGANYELSGDRANLRAGVPYEIAVRQQGSSITLEVDGVDVAATTLPAARNQPRQIGVFVVSQSQVSISGFRADIERPKAFIVMQFSSPYNEVYSHVVKDVCQECNIDALRADEIYAPGIIIKDVIDRIAQPQVVIADISPTNPNVYFEVGYALTLGKPIILLAQRRPPETPLPFDLSAFRVLFYDDSIGEKPKLEVGLRNHLREILRKE